MKFYQVRYIRNFRYTKMTNREFLAYMKFLAGGYTYS